MNHIVARARRYAHSVVSELVTDYGISKDKAINLVSKEKWAKEIAERAASAQGVTNVADLIADEEGLMFEE